MSESERKTTRSWWAWGSAGPLSPQTEYLLYALLIVVVLPGVFLDQPVGLRISSGVLTLLVAARLVFLVVTRRRRTGRTVSK